MLRVARGIRRRFSMVALGIVAGLMQTSERAPGTRSQRTTAQSVSGPTISRSPVRWKHRRPGASRPRRGLARLAIFRDLLTDPTPVRCSQVRVAFSYPAFARIRSVSGAVWLGHEGQPPFLVARMQPPEGWAGGSPTETLDDVTIYTDEDVAQLLLEAGIAIRWLPFPVRRLSAAWYHADAGLSLPLPP